MMSFLLKSAVIFLIVAVAGGFLINQVPPWKQRVIEVINPAAKEARLLGELKVNLDELNNTLNSPAGSGNQNQASKSTDLLARAKDLVDEIASANQQNSGIIKQRIGKIIDAFIDKTPYPADHLKVTTNNSPSPICPPVKWNPTGKPVVPF